MKAITRRGYIFEGDPYIYISEQGSDNIYRGGQPVMDQGIENAVFVSLFTPKNWAANRILPADEKYVSEFEEIAKQPITLTMLNQLAQAARAALKWMIKENIASQVEVNCFVPTGFQIHTEIKITPPGQSIKTLLITRHGQNWIMQKTIPAFNEILGVTSPNIFAPTNIFVDPDFENAGVADHSAASSAVLTKESGARPGSAGSQVLRITHGGVNNPESRQTILISGKTYRVTGWGRGTGAATAIPRVLLQSVSIWTGSASTSWQYFDETVVSNGTLFRLYSNLSAAGSVEFDDVSVLELD